MKDFLKEIIRLWWVEGGTELKNPKSEASIKALRVVLKEELDFPNEAIEYIIENIKYYLLMIVKSKKLIKLLKIELKIKTKTVI